MQTATLESLAQAINDELNRGEYGPVQSLVANPETITEEHETNRRPAGEYVRVSDDATYAHVPVANAEALLAALQALPEECPWEDVWETVCQFGIV